MEPLKFLSAADSARTGILFPGNALALNAFARLRAAQALKTMQNSGTQATLGLGLLLGVYGLHLADVSRLAKAGRKENGDCPKHS